MIVRLIGLGLVAEGKPTEFSCTCTCTLISVVWGNIQHSQKLSMIVGWELDLT